LVFAGGIGERGSKLRIEVVIVVKCLGFALDKSKNEEPGKIVVTDISADGSQFKMLICQTDEQLEIAIGVMEDKDRFMGKK